MEGRCGRKKSQLGEIKGGRGGMKKEGIKGVTNEVMLEEGCQQWGMKRKKENKDI